MIVGVARAGSDVRDGDCWSAVPPPCNLYGTDTCRFLHRSSPYTNSPHRLYNNDNDNDNDDNDNTDSPYESSIQMVRVHSSEQVCGYVVGTGRKKFCELLSLSLSLSLSGGGVGGRGAFVGSWA